MKRLAEEKAARGRAGEFRVAPELCRRKMVGVLMAERICTGCMMKGVAAAQSDYLRYACA